MNKLLEDREKALSLFGIYEPLLTEKQDKFFKSYYVYDLSLSEIALEEGISRSAVSMALSSALMKMEEEEEKLHLLKNKTILIQRIEKILQKGGDIEIELARLKEDIENGI